MGMHIKEDGSPAYTEDFSAHIFKTKFEDLSLETVHAAKRGVLDWLGCALIGSQHSTPDILIDTLKEKALEKKMTTFEYFVYYAITSKLTNKNELVLIK